MCPWAGPTPSKRQGSEPLPYPKACRISAMISSICSRPTEIRTIPSVIPTDSRSSLESLPWVVEAGWVTMLRESPRLEERVSKFMESKNFFPASSPPLTSKATMEPPADICFRATSYRGWDFRKGYFTQDTFGWASNWVASSRALAQCRSTRTAKVSRLLERIQALKGESEGPVILEKR